MKTAAIGVVLTLVSLASTVQGVEVDGPEQTLAKVEHAYVRVADNVFLQRAPHEPGKADEEVWVEVRFRNDAKNGGRHVMMLRPLHSRIEIGDLVEVRLAQNRRAPRVAPLPDASRILRLAAKGFSAQAKAFDGVAGTERGSERELVRLDFSPGRLVSSRGEF